MRLHLPREISDQLREAAVRAYPNEACGLLEGTRSDALWTIEKFHETENVADEKTRRFLVDPEAQLKLMKDLRGTGRFVVACFHSHPDGVARPSDKDLEDAGETDLLYIVAGGEPEFGFSLAAYVIDRGFFRSVGLDIV